MVKVKVRLTLRPDEDWEVEEDEVPGLRAQGLVAGEPADPPAKPAPAGKTTDPKGA